MALPLANNTETQWLDIATSRDAVGVGESCFATVFNSSQVRFETEVDMIIVFLRL